MKIGIVCAMTKELMPLLSGLGKVNQEKINGFSAYKLSKGNNDLIIIQSGIGEIYASGATATLISLGVEQIYNFGVCGSLCEDYLSCDTVAVNGVVHYDFDLSPIDDVEVAVYPSETTPVINAKSWLFDLIVSKFPNLKQGVCASADKFVADESIKENLRKTYGAGICDMESAGVLLTAKTAGIPCFILKTVSDGKGGSEEYLKTVNTASSICAELILEVIK